MNSAVQQWAALSRFVSPHVLAAATRRATLAYRQLEAERGTPFARRVVAWVLADRPPPQPVEALASAPFIAAAVMLAGMG